MCGGVASQGEEIIRWLLAVGQQERKVVKLAVASDSCLAELWSVANASGTTWEFPKTKVHLFGGPIIQIYYNRVYIGFPLIMESINLTNCAGIDQPYLIVSFYDSNRGS